jgi:hypothetical protein
MLHPHKRSGEDPGIEPLGEPICIRLPLGIDKIIRALPDRTDWLRSVVEKAASKIPGQQEEGSSEGKK